MTALHLVLGVSVIALNGVAGAWGGIAWLRDQPSIAFWYLLRTAQVVVFVQVMLGSILVLIGHQSPQGLHYLYGVLPLPVSLLAEAARGGAAVQELGDTDFESLPSDRQRTFALAIVRRETGIMALSCLVILFLALRAAATSTAF